MIYGNKKNRQKLLLMLIIIILSCCSFAASEYLSQDDSKLISSSDKEQSAKNNDFALLPKLLQHTIKEKYPGWKILKFPSTLASELKSQATGDFDGDSWNDHAITMFNINSDGKLCYKEIAFLYRDIRWEDHVLFENCTHRSVYSDDEAENKGSEEKGIHVFLQSFDYGGLYVDSPNSFTIEPEFPSQKMLVISSFHNLASVYEFQKGKFVKIHQSD